MLTLGRIPVSVLSQKYILDPDAAAYITAVEAADGQALEGSVRLAYDTFFKGVKADGNLDKLKASCILAGARTLAGALVPLVSTMPSPTNVGFVAGDRSRLLGLTGNGTSKYLSSNYNNNQAPQNNRHIAIYYTGVDRTGINPPFAGTSGTGGRSFLNVKNTVTAGVQSSLSNNSLTENAGVLSNTGFIGISRSASANYTVRRNSADIVVTAVSETPLNADIRIFAREAAATNPFSAHTILFWSLGEAVNLSTMELRLSTLAAALATL